MSPIAPNELKKDRLEITGAEVVCLVDDDPSVRKPVSRLLESDGFSVRAFSEPQAFLKMSRQTPSRSPFWISGWKA